MKWKRRMRNKNYIGIKKLLKSYGEKYGITGVNVVTSLHDASINKAVLNNPCYVYDSKHDMEVIDMDAIAKDIYKVAKKAEGNPVNTADAFVIKQNNEWCFIEFKDTTIVADKKSLKDNIIKKAYANWYMLLDILYDMKNLCEEVDFNYINPVDFARKHVVYIVVCSCNKNPNVYTQIKNNSYSNQNYTPIFMQKLKDYLFKDAYIYTEDFFEREFVRKFLD